MNTTYVQRPFSNFTGIKKFFKGESNVTKLNCISFKNELFKNSTNPRVLVIGSGEMGSGTTELWNDRSISIVGADIYATEFVDIICDAHYLPFDSCSYDGVWIQAVLEHVIEPHVVVSEIYRILKVNGIVYAETPFMQQVHEGAYDFTRYTVLGHRYLFKNFENISIGGVGGAHISFVWSLRYLIFAITRNRNFSRLVGLVSSLILRPLGFLVSKSSMFDSSSGVFFLGRKILDFKITHKELIQLYRGQM